MFWVLQKHLHQIEEGKLLRALIYINFHKRQVIKIKRFFNLMS